MSDTAPEGAVVALGEFTAEEMAVVRRWLAGVGVQTSLSELRGFVLAWRGEKSSGREIHPFKTHEAATAVLGLLRELAE